MSQARTGAWWRQAHNDLELAELARSNGFHAQACFFATQAAEKALKGAILELGCQPPHTHVLGQLVKLLTAEGLDVTALDPLPLPALSRMTVTSRYPLDDTPPSELFDARDSDQALTTAKAVLNWVEQLDQPQG
ncbi:MAG: HEPN domain-containing protein [Synechococcaceae cyanobacterium ELA263]